MFLRFHARIKDGKDHRYWSVVENRRCGRGKVVQRQVLYLGGINDSQHESWCRTIEISDEKTEQTMPLALFPADRQLPNFAAGFGVQIRLTENPIKKSCSNNSSSRDRSNRRRASALAESSWIKFKTSLL
jgi:hypothetical protein